MVLSSPWYDVWCGFHPFFCSHYLFCCQRHAFVQYLWLHYLCLLCYYYGYNIITVHLLLLWTYCILSRCVIIFWMLVLNSLDHCIQCVHPSWQGMKATYYRSDCIHTTLPIRERTVVWLLYDATVGAFLMEKFTGIIPIRASFSTLMGSDHKVMHLDESVQSWWHCFEEALDLLRLWSSPHATLRD